MTELHREGYYKDRYGRWQQDRRTGEDRRALARSFPLDHERRSMFRRRADREVLETDHLEMIEEALEEFADEHDGHL